MSAVSSSQPFDLLRQMEGQISAARLDVAAGYTESWTGLAFRVRQFWLLAPREDVREIIRKPKLTRVPGATAWLPGVANVRGSLLPVTDLGLWLGFPAAPEKREQRVLVFNSDRVPAGFLVDEVAGYRQFAPGDQRHELVESAEAMRPFLLGGFNREARDWRVLSLQKVTRDPRFVAAGA